MSTLERPQQQAMRPGARETTQLGAHVARWLAAGLAAIGGGLVTVAVLGPLGIEAIDYRVTETLRNQTIGLDFVSLVLVAPLALLAAALVFRGHLACEGLLRVRQLCSQPALGRATRRTSHPRARRPRRCNHPG